MTTEQTQGGAAPTVKDEVIVRIPAEGAYLSVLRMVTAGLAARLNFTLDEIEDLKIAVDEACAMLLSQAVPGGDIVVGFNVERDALRVQVTVATLDGRAPSRDTFSWTVLTALAGEVDASVDSEDRVTIVLHKQRDVT
ncbi:MAG TPA: anti-sigma regulatory factor [Mycobacteriales bacterium]|nr:anti-sigma regulatory factor [Mycobacteriales bacterium]